jgi:hypothetical protein
MKTAQIVGRVLALFNLIIWSILLAGPLLSALASFNPLVLVMLVLFAAMPLHSYAALQLQRSLRQPEVKLSHQTPVGIRFVGLIALFIGIFVVICGCLVLKDAKEWLPLMKEQMASLNKQQDMSTITVGYLRGVGGFMLIAGLAVIVSVLIHLRLLRWYYLVKQSDVS